MFRELTYAGITAAAIWASYKLYLNYKARQLKFNYADKKYIDKYSDLL